MIQNFSYGKSGGQGISPLIVVTAPTGSTVTCDGVQGTEVSGTWTFPVIIGTHTIVASLSGKTATQSVVVDQVAVFNVVLDYRTYLYNEGDECTTLTGGWISKTKNNGTTTKNADSLEGYSTTTANSYGLWVTTNKINFTGYSSLKFLVVSVVVAGFAFISTTSQTGLDIELGLGTGERTVSLASYQNSYYLDIGGEVGNGAIKRGCKVSKIWLE